MMPGNNTAAALRSGVERIEGIDGEIEALKEQIKGLKGDRKATLSLIRSETGFIPKVTDQIVRERKMDPMLRSAFETQLSIARATMGMLAGTPLGDAARRAYDPPPPAPSETRIDDEAQDPLPGVEDEPKASGQPTQDDIDRAWQEGATAAKEGKKVTDNPYPASEPAMRAAHDEGWCHEKGSDGMDIPDALKPKKKKGDGDSGADRSDERRAA